MKRYITFTILMLLLLAGYHSQARASAQAQASPELPRVFLDTRMPTLTGKVIAVAAGGNFQTALNNALPGDTITLASGATYSGNFTLPNKPGSQWIIIKSSSSALPAEGTRITPAQAAQLPKLITPNTQPVISTADGAHHFRFIGIEFGIAPGVGTNYGIVALGRDNHTQLSQVPNNLILDRCLVRGNDTGDCSRGIALNSASTAIIDSYISNIHGAGFDTQAIASWTGPGPYKIVNNYLEGAGENFLAGGAGIPIQGLIASDIEFRRNHCFKPLSWKGRWTVKNLFELKNAQRVLVEGNLFENNWVDGQSGVAILFTPRNQEKNTPWVIVADITFRNNIVRNSPGAINNLGFDNEAGNQNQQTRRIAIVNNLFENIGNDAFLIQTETPDVTVDHNTVLHRGNIITAYGKPSPGFKFTNNIVGSPNGYGILGENVGEGKAAITTFFPGSVVVGNALIGREFYMYPASGFKEVKTLADVGFVDMAAGNYRLAATSPLKSKATDGKDIGADIDAIVSAMSGNVPAPPPQPPPPAPTSTTLFTVTKEGTETVIKDAAGNVVKRFP